MRWLPNWWSGARSQTRRRGKARTSVPCPTVTFQIERRIPTKSAATTEQGHDHADDCKDPHPEANEILHRLVDSRHRRSSEADAIRPDVGPPHSRTRSMSEDGFRHGPFPVQGQSLVPCGVASETSATSSLSPTRRTRRSHREYPRLAQGPPELPHSDPARVRGLRLVVRVHFLCQAVDIAIPGRSRSPKWP
jgi:hypothetical protein